MHNYISHKPMRYGSSDTPQKERRLPAQIGNRPQEKHSKSMQSDCDSASTAMASDALSDRNDDDLVKNFSDLQIVLEKGESQLESHEIADREALAKEEEKRRDFLLWKLQRKANAQRKEVERVEAIVDKASATIAICAEVDA